MKETQFAQKLHEAIKNKGKVTQVSLEIGELAPISEDLLKYEIKRLIDCDVEVKNGFSKVICRCGYRGSPRIVHKRFNDVLFTCPKCHGLPTVLEGDNVILLDVKTETENDQIQQ